MRILSLWQPWATLMANGDKRVETRSWSTPYRGPVALHAARKWNRELEMLAQSQPFQQCLGDLHLDPLPLGAILAVGKLVDVAPMSVERRGESVFERWPSLFTAKELAFGNYEPGRFAWIFDEVRPLEKPLPWKGSQGFPGLPLEVTAVLARSTIDKE